MTHNTLLTLCYSLDGIYCMHTPCRALMSSKSVPFDQAVVKNGNGRVRRKLPMTPDEAGPRNLGYVEGECVAFQPLTLRILLLDPCDLIGQLILYY